MEIQKPETTPIATAVGVPHNVPKTERAATCASMIGSLCVTIASTCAMLYFLYEDEVIGVIAIGVLLLIQSVLAVEHLPCLRLNAYDYLTTSPVFANVEDPTDYLGAGGGGTASFFTSIRGNTHRNLLVVYKTSKDGRTFLVRKELFGGPFDGDLIPSSDIKTDSFDEAMKDDKTIELLLLPEAPFSGYPRYAINRIRSRQLLWLVFGLPLWFATFLVFCAGVGYCWFYISLDNIDVILLAIVLASVLVLTPLMYYQRSWKDETVYGGQVDERGPVRNLVQDLEG